MMNQQGDSVPYMNKILKHISDEHSTVVANQQMDYQISAPAMERYGFADNRLAQDNFLNMPMNNTLVPVYHDSSNTTTFVNSKQYQPILRLRCKKLKKMKKLETLKNSISKNLSVRKLKKQKVKYESRSNHAKNRQRADNGKFVRKDELALEGDLAKEVKKAAGNVPQGSQPGVGMDGISQSNYGHEVTSHVAAQQKLSKMNMFVEDGLG